MKTKFNTIMMIIVLVAFSIMGGSLVNDYIQLCERNASTPSSTEIAIDNLVKDSEDFCELCYQYYEEYEAE